jgi:hypothetical protein
MKPAIIILLTVVAVIVAGYFGGPLLIDKHTSDLLFQTSGSMC